MAAPWGAIIQGVNSAIGAIGSGIMGSRMGKKQMKMGQQMQEEARSLSAAYKRPEMQTPQAIQMMMEMSRGRMNQNMPGMTQQQNQINKATAGGVQAYKEMGTGAEAFGGVADLYANQLDRQGELGTENKMYQDQNQQDYLGDLQGLGDIERENWGWNKADPYLNAQEKAAQLEMAGRQGEWEGLKNKMGSWAEAFSGFGSQGAPDMTMSSLFGGGKNKAA
jgi:hypothetical protein